MPGHPNATAGGIGGALGVLVVWLLGEFGVSVTAEPAAAIATVCAALVLLVGRAFGRKSAPPA